MTPNPKTRIKILSRPHKLQRPDPKNGPLLAVNTIMARLCERVEAQTRAGERNFAAETWAELASDVAHSLPERKVVCIQEGNETNAFKNLKLAFERSLNKKVERSEITNTIALMVHAARAATGGHDCDKDHQHLVGLLESARILDPKDNKAFASLFANQPEEKAPATAAETAAAEPVVQGKKADLSNVTRVCSLHYTLEGKQYTFPVLSTGNIVAVIQPRDYHGVSITNMAEHVRDILRKNLGEHIRIAQVYETDPSSVSEITGSTGGGPEWKRWEGEVPGLKTWLLQHSENQNS